MNRYGNDSVKESDAVARPRQVLLYPGYSNGRGNRDARRRFFRFMLFGRVGGDGAPRPLWGRL